MNVRNYTYILRQFSTDKDERKIGHMLIIPFPVWARIKINASPNRFGIKTTSRTNQKCNYGNVHIVRLICQEVRTHVDNSISYLGWN